MSRTIIHVKQLIKDYESGAGPVRILAGLNLDIQQGEFAAIMGPSGSGKSTFMNILGCLDTPTLGRYQLNGHEISHLNADQLADIRNQYIGFVFQGFNLLPRTTLAENVALPLIYAGIKKKNAALALPKC